MQTAKEYLKQTWTLDAEIKSLQIIIEKLETKAEKTTSKLLEKEKEFIAIGELIDRNTKHKLYEMVS